jgi:hypothetical protein
MRFELSDFEWTAIVHPPSAAMGGLGVEYLALGVGSALGIAEGERPCLKDQVGQSKGLIPGHLGNVGSNANDEFATTARAW